MIELKSRFTKLFFKSCLKNDDIFKILNKKSHQINLINVVRTCKKLNLFKKIMTKVKNENNEKLINFVKKIFINHNVQIYEKKKLYYFFRKQNFLMSK